MSALIKHKRRREEDVAKPQLTSLIDVMTILLVFLLKSFSVDNAIITVPDEVNLSESSSKNKVEKALSIEVTQQYIAIDGERIATEDASEEALSQLLQKAKSRTYKNQEVLIQCDKDVEFALLKSLLQTCSKEKIKVFSLLVKQEG